MRRVLHFLLLLVWGLWFGGLIALFLFVQTLFKDFRGDRAVAVQTAPHLFLVFQKYQLILGAAGLLLSAIAWLWRRSAARIAVFALFALASAGAIVSPLAITPKMERLRAAGESHTEQFMKLHGESMLVYLAETAALLVAGMVMPTELSPTNKHGDTEDKEKRD